MFVLFGLKSYKNTADKTDQMMSFLDLKIAHRHGRLAAREIFGKHEMLEMEISTADLTDIFIIINTKNVESLFFCPGGQ